MDAETKFSKPPNIIINFIIIYSRIMIDSYDLLEDRRIDDISTISWVLSDYAKQIDPEYIISLLSYCDHSGTINIICSSKM